MRNAGCKLSLGAYFFWVCPLVMSAETTSPKTAALSGQVVDAGGHPLAGASISVIPLTSDSSPFRLATSEEGTFAVPLLPTVPSLAAPRIEV
jgi:hypothetical protein